jgi:hypothetical protein
MGYAGTELAGSHLTRRAKHRQDGIIGYRAKLTNL